MFLCDSLYEERLRLQGTEAEAGGSPPWWMRPLASMANTLVIRPALFQHLAKRGIQVRHEGILAGHDRILVGHEGRQVGHEGVLVEHEGTLVGHEGTLVSIDTKQKKNFFLMRNR